MSSATPEDFSPTATLETLRARAELLTTIRAFFVARGFLEVETPILSHDTVVDRHLDPFETRWLPDVARPARGETLYLQTSPEYALKRLLTAGAGPIFQIGKAFRNGEVGALHNPEFTMLEWYVPGDDYAAGIRLLSDLAEATLARGAAETLTYAAAFQREYDLCPHTAAIERLRTAALDRKLHAPESLGEDRNAWLDFLLTERIQPTLGNARPTILCDYPATQAALAKIREADPPVAERFELYVDGIELANGYHELLDADALDERSAKNNASRIADGKPKLPEKSRLSAAMRSGLPACSGCALGFDRLLMVKLGLATIAEAIAFPFDRA